MRSAWKWAIAAALLAPLAACGPKHATPAPTGVSLAGAWVLNAEASEAPGSFRADTAGGETVDGEPAGEPGDGMRGRGGYGGRGGRGGFGGRGGYGGRGGMRGGRGGMGRGFAALRERPEHLVVEQGDTTVTISVPGGRSMELVTDGKKRKLGEDRGREREDESTVRARWKDGALVVDTGMGGLTLRRTYERAPGSPRLIVTTALIGGPREIQFRTVYDTETKAP